MAKIKHGENYFFGYNPESHRKISAKLSVHWFHTAYTLQCAAEHARCIKIFVCVFVCSMHRHTELANVCHEPCHTINAKIKYKLKQTKIHWYKVAHEDYKVHKRRKDTIMPPIIYSNISLNISLFCIKITYNI